MIFTDKQKSIYGIIRHLALIALSLVAVIVCYHRIIFIKYAEENSATAIETRTAYIVIAVVVLCWVAVIGLLTVKADSKERFLLLDLPVDISTTANIVYWLDHAMTWEFWLYKLALAGEVFLLSYLFFMTVSKSPIGSRIRMESRTGPVSDILKEYRLYVLYMCCVLINSLFIPREGYVYDHPWRWVFILTGIILSGLYLVIMNKKKQISVRKLTDTGQVNRKEHKEKIAFLVFTAIIVIFSNMLISVTLWYDDTFGVTLDEIIFTIFAPMKGADVSFLKETFKYIVPSLGVSLVVLLIIVYIHNVGSEKTKYITGVLCLVLLVFSFQYLDQVLCYIDYVRFHSTYTTIYEDYYIDPGKTTITAKNKPKNLIYVYIESMETTYASTDVGGWQEINYIPGLTSLAEEHTSFSNTDKLGGFHCANKTGWTMAGILSTSAGISWCMPAGEQNMSKHTIFAPNLITIGDILEEEGYTQEFLCGSNAKFAGRDVFFRSHGDFEIFDYYTAIEQGYIPEDYFVWWGYEDSYLYQIAKDEALRLAKGSEPFNLTLLTVDMHPTDGYICDLCGDEYPEQLANVVACADRQIIDFVDWCREQDFYEDTLIVITGDHPRMDTALVSGIDLYDRTVYNCFINADATKEYRTNNREYTHMDIFPTVLSGLGYEIEGDRLGLGTNLFSDKPTLAEELGYEYLNRELGYYSEYYKTHFY